MFCRILNIDVFLQRTITGMVELGGLRDKLPAEAYELDDVSNEADSCERFHYVRSGSQG